MLIWLTLLGMVFSSFIYVYQYFDLFGYSSSDGNMLCFYLLVIVNTPPVGIGMEVIDLNLYPGNTLNYNGY